MINLNWSTLWKITSDNAITSGVVSGTIVNVLTRMFDNTTHRELKVQEAYFQEKKSWRQSKYRASVEDVKP